METQFFSFQSSFEVFRAHSECFQRSLDLVCLLTSPLVEWLEKEYKMHSAWASDTSDRTFFSKSPSSWSQSSPPPFALRSSFRDLLPNPLPGLHIFTCGKFHMIRRLSMSLDGSRKRGFAEAQLAIDRQRDQKPIIPWRDTSLDSNVNDNLGTQSTKDYPDFVLNNRQRDLNHHLGSAGSPLNYPTLVVTIV